MKAPDSDVLPVQPAHLVDRPIKLPVAAGHQFHLVTNKPDRTGPDRTTVNPAHITRQFTSLIALGLIAARSGVCITERNFGNERAYSFETSAVFCCGSAEQSMGNGGQRKIQMENLGTLKLTNSRFCEHGINGTRNGEWTD